jgi:hypothetical protein
MTTRLIADALLHIGVNAYPSLGGTGDVVLDLRRPPREGTRPRGVALDIAR